MVKKKKKKIFLNGPAFTPSPPPSINGLAISGGFFLFCFFPYHRWLFWEGCVIDVWYYNNVYYSKCTIERNQVFRFFVKVIKLYYYRWLFWKGSEFDVCAASIDVLLLPEPVHPLPGLPGGQRPPLQAVALPLGLQVHPRTPHRQVDVVQTCGFSKNNRCKFYGGVHNNLTFLAKIKKKIQI